MKAFQRAQNGLTLVEALLAFVVVAVLVMAGTRQYQVHVRDKEVREILYNVDVLAQAAANFYWANCGAQYDPPSHSYTVGRLHPNSAPTNPFVLNIQTDLINSGYMPAAANLSKGNFIVPAGNGQYSVQFNQASSPRMILACNDAACTTSSQQQIGTNIFWRIQVSVRVSNIARATYYRDLTGATCVSNAGAPAGSILPCATAPAGANTFLVFERAPAFPTPTSRSALTQNNTSLHLFNQPYTTFPITHLTTNSHSPEYQYFLCSGY